MEDQGLDHLTEGFLLPLLQRVSKVTWKLSMDASAFVNVTERIKILSSYSVKISIKQILGI